MPPSPPARATSSRRQPLPSVSIVVPVRDAAALSLTLRGLPPADEVIVVTDVPGAAAAVRAACPDALLTRPARAGIGAALARGFAVSTGDIVVALDGAGSTDPAEIPRFVDALLAGADVAVGSRYGEGGQDLTGGRFRRWANLLLIWAVNLLFGVRRTDPGFGYAAFWRAAIERLDLPDPSGRAPAAWGDGPEFAALLTVRTAARGLSVAEVGSIAYPRLGRAARTDRTTLRHWLRAIATEYPTRTRPLAGPRPARHAAPASLPVAPPVAPPLPPAQASSRASSKAPAPAPASSSASASAPASSPAPVPALAPASVPAPAARAGWPRPSVASPARQPTGGDRRANRGRYAPGLIPPPIEPLWGPPRRRPGPPGDLWRTATSSPLDRNPGHTPRRPHLDVKPPRPAPAQPDRGLFDHDASPTPAAGPDRRDALPVNRVAGPDAPGARLDRGYVGRRNDDQRGGLGGDQRGGDEQGRDEPEREVGARRRRLEAYRQRPDLRVINGEGTTGRSRSGRLRAVPRENPSG